MTATDVVAPAEVTLSLAERARQAHADAVADAEAVQRAENARYRAHAIEQLRRLLARVLDVTLDDAQIIQAEPRVATAVIDGLLFRWTERGADWNGDALTVLRVCVRCGEETVPVYVGDLDDLGRALAAGAHMHRSDCTDGLAPEAEPPRPELTTEQKLIALLRDFIAEETADLGGRLGEVAEMRAASEARQARQIRELEGDLGTQRRRADDLDSDLDRLRRDAQKAQRGSSW